MGVLSSIGVGGWLSSHRRPYKRERRERGEEDAHRNVFVLVSVMIFFVHAWECLFVLLSRISSY